MTNHDRFRKERAEAIRDTYTTKQEELESLSDAIRGLQSTDDPSLNHLHDKLMGRYLRLKKDLSK